jgi:hypothetical protein
MLGFKLEGVMFRRSLLLPIMLFVGLCANISVASAGDQFKGKANKIPSLSCEGACNFAFERCVKKARVDPKQENVCCTKEQTSALQKCVTDIFHCKQPCPAGNPWKHHPAPPQER